MTLRQAPPRNVVVVIAVLAVFAVAGIVLTAAWMSALTIPGFERFFYNENDVIMQVSLDNTGPLILSVKAKSNCSDLS